MRNFTVIANMVTNVTSRRILITAGPYCIERFFDLRSDGFICPPGLLAQRVAARAFRQPSLKSERRQRHTGLPNLGLDVFGMHIPASLGFCAYHDRTSESHVCDPISHTFVTYVNAFVS